VLVSSCTPREIEQDTTQTTLPEMPRPGGSVQHVLDSIKRELAIKRLEKEVMQRMMDSVREKFIGKKEKRTQNRDDEVAPQRALDAPADRVGLCEHHS
jgi:hypothetical protein